MRNVDTRRQWLLSAACMALWGVLITAYADPEGPKAYKPGRVEHKQITINLPAQQLGDDCGADIEIRFQQRSDKARVITEINNEHCAASSGNYKLQLRITDDGGERQTLTFSEAWSRDDALPIETTRFYDIGYNVDLNSVRLKASSCKCAEKPVAPEQPQ